MPQSGHGSGHSVGHSSGRVSGHGGQHADARADMWPDTWPRPEALSADTLADVFAWLDREFTSGRKASRVAVPLLGTDAWRRLPDDEWAAHTHLMDLFDSTPRLAFLSPEPGSGKTRALEVTELLVPNPMLAVSASTAALFRAVADMAGRPTILFDEIDTVFGPKAKENEELRGLLNAGHRRSGVSYRCVGDGANQKVVAFPSYAAMAMGGLGSLPDTILTRSVIVRMRKRGPGEKVEAFRARLHEPQGHALRKRLAEWAKLIADRIAGVYPEMPEGVNDRPADVWEPLLIVADAAGGAWSERGRAACVELLATATPDSVSLGVRLLMDIRSVLAEREEPKIFTRDLIAALYSLPEAPWAELNKGKGLNEYSLGRFMKDYEITSKTVRIEFDKAKGYEGADFADAWERYCPAPASRESVASVASETPQVSGLEVATLPGFATDRPVAAPTGATGRVTLRSVAPLQSVASLTCEDTDATDATDLPEGGCRICGDFLHRLHEAEGIHPWCQTPNEWPALPYERTA